jgi:hypothetical protein
MIWVSTFLESTLTNIILIVLRKADYVKITLKVDFSSSFTSERDTSVFPKKRVWWNSEKELTLKRYLTVCAKISPTIHRNGLSYSQHPIDVERDFFIMTSNVKESEMKNEKGFNHTWNMRSKKKEISE